MNAQDSEPSLLLAPDCRLEFDRDHNVTITLDQSRVSLGDLGLPLVDAFRRPSRISDAMGAIKDRLDSSLAWIDYRRLLSRMQDEGMLVAEGDFQRSAPRARGFDAPSIQIAMLDDRRRTKAFIQAIEETIRPGDVVLEIGTGTGVLAAAAARAGARRVYAVEQGDIAQAAERLFYNNRLHDRISLIPGASTRIELPETADVVVGELFGHDPLEENVLESFLDARRRHMKPGGRFLPRSLTLEAIPVRVSREILARRRFTEDTLAHWQSDYALDFSALAAWQALSTAPFLAQPEELPHLHPCSPPVRFPSIEFDQWDSSIVEFKADLVIDTPGLVNGVMLGFELELNDKLTLRIDPRANAPDNHWRTPVHLLPSPFALEKGARCRIQYSFGRASAPSISIVPLPELP